MMQHGQEHKIDLAMASQKFYQLAKEDQEKMRQLVNTFDGKSIDESMSEQLYEIACRVVYKEYPPLM